MRVFPEVVDELASERASERNGFSRVSMGYGLWVCERNERAGIRSGNGSGIRNDGRKSGRDSYKVILSESQLAISPGKSSPRWDMAANIKICWPVVRFLALPHPVNQWLPFLYQPDYITISRLVSVSFSSISPSKDATHRVARALFRRVRLQPEIEDYLLGEIILRLAERSIHHRGNLRCVLAAINVSTSSRSFLIFPRPIEISAILAFAGSRSAYWKSLRGKLVGTCDDIDRSWGIDVAKSARGRMAKQFSQ